MDPVGSAPNVSQSPTITTPAMMTGVGVILGTAAYMAPEQARGRVVDRSADLWAFGCVLYEMLTGRPAFEGDDVTEIVAAIVKTEPDWTRLPTRTPRSVRTLLRQCLRKPPQQRLGDARAARLALEDAGAEEADPAGTTAIVPSPGRPQRRWGSALGWVAAGVAMLAAVTLAFGRFGVTRSTERSLHLSVPIPAGYGNVGFLALSPDAQRLALRLNREGQTQLYLRSLDSGDLQPLAGTTAPRTPFWSADGRFIGFFAENRLKVIPAAGGPTRVLCDATGLGGGGTWNQDGVILFASDSGPLRRVNAGGGPCTPVGNDRRVQTPVFMPDGHHFFCVRGSQEEGTFGTYLASLDDPSGRKILSDFSSVVYAPPVHVGEHAHLLFRRETTLMAQPFNEASLQPIGDPFPVGAGASFSFSPPQVAASASADGTLVYLAGRLNNAQLTWFDRTGKELGTVGPVVQNQRGGVVLSPKGDAAAVGRADGNGRNELRVFDVARGSESRLGVGGSAAWSPDNGRIWFNVATPEDSGVYQHDFMTAQRTLVMKTDPAVQLTISDWSHDGRFVVYTQVDPNTRADIWYVPVESGKPTGEPVQFLATDANESQGQISPDGKWLAYSETGAPGDSGVYIRAFPRGGQVWPVSVGSGVEPRWRRDGKELYFISPSPNADRMIVMAARIEPGSRNGLLIGAPQRLFDFRGGWLCSRETFGRTVLIPTDASW